MENEELMRIIQGKERTANGLNLILSKGKRLRNVDDPLDSIDIEHLVRIKELPVYPKLHVRDDSILMECKCGKWLFVNPKWKNAYRPNYPARRP